MPSFIDVVTKNPALAESFKESTNKYLVPAILATLGTGAISYGIAGSKKRIGESDSARRRRIIRATLLPTLAAAVGSTALIGANTLLNTDSNSFKLTRDILTDREKNNADINAPITKEDLANLNAKQNKPSAIDAFMDSMFANSSGMAASVARPTIDAIGGLAAGGGVAKIIPENKIPIPWRTAGKWGGKVVPGLFKIPAGLIGGGLTTFGLDKLWRGLTQ